MLSIVPQRLLRHSLTPVLSVGLASLAIATALTRLLKRECDPEKELIALERPVSDDLLTRQVLSCAGPTLARFPTVDYQIHDGAIVLTGAVRAEYLSEVLRAVARVPDVLRVRNELILIVNDACAV